jgi:hypothetical protein
MKHDDLTKYIATGDYDTDATLECYFHDYSGNLHFVYIGDFEIVNIMSANTISALEKEYNRYCRQVAKEHELDLAIERYESSQS